MSLGSAAMPYRFMSLAAHDLPAITQHLLDLDPDDRVMRFNTTAPDPVIVAYCGRWNFAADIAEGAWDGDRLVGIVHMPVFQAGADLAGELGVSVASNMRKRHIGTQLLALLLDRSRARGLDRIYINFLTRNRAMTALARRFTRDIAMDGDETVATIHLERNTTEPEAAVSATPA